MDEEGKSQFKAERPYRFGAMRLGYGSVFRDRRVNNEFSSEFWRIFSIAIRATLRNILGSSRQIKSVISF